MDKKVSDFDGATSLEEMQQRLAPFLSKHKTSSVSYDAAANKFWLVKPWGDDSIDIGLDGKPAIVGTLNGLLLPERYSAIYHEAEKKLEVIYTVFKPFAGEDIRTRAFDFHHGGKVHRCSFGPSSGKLLEIARHTRQKEGFGQTNYRNLVSYYTYSLIAEGQIEPPAELKDSYKDAQPISFWIESLEWDDDEVLDLIHHLNFYMTYFDNNSPSVLIHTPEDESRSFKSQDRFPFGNFPGTINSQPIDRNLLHIWQASRSGDPARRFLYCYQILEYASHAMVEDDVSRTITKLLLAPDALYRAQSLSTQIIETLGASKIADSQKVEMLLRKFVSPERVWAAIEKNKEYFCKPADFEGGYKVNALVQQKWEVTDFKTNWPGPFASAIRNIRNALSHGKEARMASVITPTAANLRILTPWVSLVAAAAREIMVYRSLD